MAANQPPAAAASGSSSSTAPPLHHSAAAGAGLVGALGGLLPPLFLEARVNGSEQLIAQLGFSVSAGRNLDVAILTRTSGAAFAVGIGSFVAYKLFWRLLRSNCLWTALEQSLVNAEATKGGQGTEQREEAIELTEGFYAVRLGGENELLRRLDECLGGSPTEQGPAAAGKVAVVQIRQASVLKQLFRRTQRIKSAGIGQLEDCGDGEDDGMMAEQQQLASRGHLLFRHWGQQQRQQSRWSRDEDEQSSLSGLSDLTSASRIAPNPRLVDPASDPLPEEFADDEPAAAQPRLRRGSGCSSTSSTPVSASLQLNCDNELCWDNEFSAAASTSGTELDDQNDGSGLFLFRERAGSLGGISQLSAMKNLEQMFSRDWQRDWQQQQQQEGVEDMGEEAEDLVENALHNLREMDQLNGNTSSPALPITGREQQQLDGDRQVAAAGNGMARRPSTNEGTKVPAFTAYRIVLQNEFDPSEVSSTRSTPSRFEKRHSLAQQQPDSAKPGQSQGIWELTSLGTNSLLTKEKKPCQSESANQRHAHPAGQLGIVPAAMVDSVISFQSHSSLASTSRSRTSVDRQRRGQEEDEAAGVMYDSAIVTDYLGQSGAEEEEWRDRDQHTQQQPPPEDKKTNLKSGIFRRFGGDLQDIDRPLSMISERSTPVKQSNASRRDSSRNSSGLVTQPPSSIQGSQPSLEWF